MSNPFDNVAARDALFAAAGVRDLGFKGVATTGSGPFSEDDFDEFLRRYDFLPRVIGELTTVVVVGRTEWAREAFGSMLFARSGQQLWVYSQEMFLAYLLTGIDPLNDAACARALGDGHPALAWLETIGFEWPTTRVTGGGVTPVPGNWREVGFLKCLGYTVGNGGRSELDRHIILLTAYITPGPRYLETEYLAKWGPPQSAARLKKIANSIAAFCRNHRRLPNPSSQAISDWEADLDWLKTTLYDGRHQFQWPGTDVW
jgi:hypothetical protein